MIDSGDQLREAFENHENLAPDPAAVYARVQELSRAYQRRRWGAQAAGGVVLAGALVAGGLVVPGLIGGKADKPAVTVAAGAAPSPGPTAIPVGSDLTKDWAAYFGAGYDYDNAVALAKIWKSKADIGTIKAQAGALLLAGKTLPVKPDPANVASAKEESEVNAFFEAGYTTEDAATLAGIWKTKDTYAAKVEGGTKLLAGQTLPIKPNPAAVKAAKESADLDAFASAGYSYQDAVTLQKLWKTKTVGAAKIEGGAKLLAGEKLPIKPHPAPTEDPAAAEADSKAVDKFFAAGYSYDDAAQLAKIWKLTDPYSAKIAGGKKLLAGQSLPIKP